MLKSKRKLDYIYLIISISLIVLSLIFKKFYGVFFLYGFVIMSLIIEKQVRSHLKDMHEKNQISASSVVSGFFVRFLIYALMLGFVGYFFGVINLCISALGFASYRHIYFVSLK